MWNEYLSDQEAILFVNEAFYRAFADRDIEAMNNLWSNKVPVSCIHPGWPPLFDRCEILKTWKEILASSDAPDIRYRNENVNNFGDTASVICIEELAEIVLAATNIFYREGSLWKIIHHQAGPTSAELQKDDRVMRIGSVH